MPRSKKNVPIKVKSIWIEQAQTATILTILSIRKNFAQQYLVAVAFVYEHVLSRTHKVVQILNFLRCNFNKMIFPEWRLDIYCIKWTTGNQFCCRFRNMLARSCKGVNILME